MIAADVAGATAVPEPSTWALLIVGLGAMAMVFRQRPAKAVA